MRFPPAIGTTTRWQTGLTAVLDYRPEGGGSISGQSLCRLLFLPYAAGGCTRQYDRARQLGSRWSVNVRAPARGAGLTFRPLDRMMAASPGGGRRPWRAHLRRRDEIPSAISNGSATAASESKPQASLHRVLSSAEISNSRPRRELSDFCNSPASEGKVDASFTLPSGTAPPHSPSSRDTRGRP
jgi:hypothetical protein